MKLWMLLSIFIAAPVMACPNLTGQYLKTFEDGTQMPVTMSQSISNGVTVYNSKFPLADTWIADGVARGTQDSERAESNQYQCVANQLIDFQVTTYLNGNGSVKCTLRRQWSLEVNARNNLHYVVKVLSNDCGDKATEADWELIRTK